ncbi:MAG: hypothetical protein QOH72_584 [Solirubrobacteraceae bacterium]|jgi:hypothetical protein|nr:hypothetical protein [Solirubrobacteraceae bacterium]
MSHMAMHDDHANGAAGAKGAAMTAILLWIVVVIALAYGLINTFAKVADLFAG